MKKSFGHENPLFSQPTFEVTIDVWENQRFKPLQGGWLGPYASETMPFYSDIHGEISVPYDKATSSPIITLPLGWQWCNDNWKVDTSNAFGLCDADGWSYSTTFENLVESSIRKKLEGEVGRLSIVRRRRWVRKMSSVTADAKKDFESRLNWAKEIRKKLEKVVAQKNADYSLISEYEFKRRATFDRILFSAEQVLTQTVQMLEGITEKLNLMKQFLVERGNIEREYAKKIGTQSQKWMYAGQESNGTNIVVVKKNPGFFFSISTVSLGVADRLNEFSGMLTESLPADVDSVIKEIQAIRIGSQKESPKLRQSLRAQEEALTRALSNYRMILEVSQGKDEAKRVNLLECLYTVSAANCLPTSIIPGSAGAEITPTASSGDNISFSAIAASSAALYFNGSPTLSSDTQAAMQSINKVGLSADVWLGVQRYKQAVLEADSALFIFKAFSIQLNRDAMQSSSRVSALLHSLIKVFASEQCRVWNDASLMLKQFVPQKRRGSATGDSSDSATQSHVGTVVAPGDASAGTDVRTGVVVSVTTGSNSAGAEINSSGRQLSSSQHESEQEYLDTEDEADELVDTAVLPVLPDCSPSCLVGQVQYIQMTRQALVELSKATASSLQQATSAPGISRSMSMSGKEDSQPSWEAGTAVVTFDGYLHLYRPQDTAGSDSSNIDRVIWIPDEPIVSIDISGAEVEPVLVPILGVRDVFEVRGQVSQQSTGPASSASRKSLSLSAKQSAFSPHLLLLSIIGAEGEADSESHTQRWMRLIANPLSNPATVPPSESNYAHQQMSAAEILKQKHALLANFVQPEPSIDGLEI